MVRKYRHVYRRAAQHVRGTANGGSVYLHVTFPGAPHADGDGGLIYVNPGIFRLDPIIPTAAPAATPAPIAAPPKAGSGGGIPPWVWITLAALVVALAGLGGFMIAQRGRVVAPAAAAAGSSVGSPPPGESPEFLPPDVV